jgi:flavin-dependent dehydrogenase
MSARVEERRMATSVLVVGTGAAGLRAAIELAERGVQVLCVGKRRRDDAHTVLASGGINAALGTMDPEDSWEQHAADTLREGYWLSDPASPLRSRGRRAADAALLRRPPLPAHVLRRRLHRARDPARPRRACGGGGRGDAR